jgi:hypothetical protein
MYSVLSTVALALRWLLGGHLSVTSLPLPPSGGMMNDSLVTDLILEVIFSDRRICEFTASVPDVQ